MSKDEPSAADRSSDAANQGASWTARVAPVTRPPAQARTVYDRIAPFYDLAEAPFERRARASGLRLLAAQPGERVLDIGPGTGHSLAAIAGRVGDSGLALGVDLSARMLARARRRAGRVAGTGRAGLVQGDACRLPLAAGTVDAVFLSFVLELFDTADIPKVLDECRRVLRADGRLAVVSLQLDQPVPLGARLYLRGRRWLPRLLDCRPIPLSDVLSGTGWRVSRMRRMSVWGIPAASVLAEPA